MPQQQTTAPSLKRDAAVTSNEGRSRRRGSRWRRRPHVTFEDAFDAIDMVASLHSSAILGRRSSSYFPW